MDWINCVDCTLKRTLHWTSVFCTRIWTHCWSLHENTTLGPHAGSLCRRASQTLTPLVNTSINISSASSSQPDRPKFYLPSVICDCQEWIFIFLCVKQPVRDGDKDPLYLPNDKWPSPQFTAYDLPIDSKLVLTWLTFCQQRKRNFLDVWGEV